MLRAGFSPLSPHSRRNDIYLKAAFPLNVVGSGRGGGYFLKREGSYGWVKREKKRWLTAHK
jgi:hypothetical protein